jgi:hypothetical protein
MLAAVTAGHLTADGRPGGVVRQPGSSAMLLA